MQLITAFTKSQLNILAALIRQSCNIFFNKIIALLLFSLSISITAQAQNKLHLIVPVNANNQPLKTVLHTLSSKGKFYFSYNSNIINEDSLVTISAQNKTIKELLDILLNGDYQYKETGDYIIIQRNASGNYYFVSGYVTDNITGEKISDVSVYEKNQLVSTFTNADGFFRLKLKDRRPSLFVNVSKVAYADTTISIQPGYNQEVHVGITPQLSELGPVVVSSKVERNWLARIFLSSRQKMQSLNIRKFFASKQYQVSLVPGIGSHGLNAQVINKVSVNIIGGYAAGTSGVELGGIFNIDKRNANHVQVAGAFNVVGGTFKGVQLAGIHNNVFDSLKGVQASGFSNLVKGDLGGVQLTGNYNVIWGNLKGVQAAGTVNLVKDKSHGVQLAGLGNISRKEMKGVQLAGLFNYTHYSRGVQIALVNIADSSSGYSIGLINIVKKGYHKLSVYSNEMLNVNMAYKSGSRKLYSILLVGMNIAENNKAYTIGYGIGKEMMLNQNLSIATELTSQNLYLGDWKSFPSLYRFQPSFNVRFSKNIALFAGPTFSVFHSKQTHTIPGYKSGPSTGYPGFNFGSNTRAWFGWHVGTNLF